MSADRLRAAAERRYRAHRLRRLIREQVGDVRPLAFDVGANIGEWTAALRSFGASVVAVDPQRACADALRKRFLRDPEVRVEQVALGDGPAQLELLLPVTGHTGQATLSERFTRRLVESHRMPAGYWGPGYTVDVTTLDALIEAHGEPRFCKIDVEGYEPNVLAGLSRPVSCLIFEFHHELLDHTAACVERLAALGDYEFVPVLDSCRVPLSGALEGRQLVDALQELGPDAWGNVLARRRSSHRSGSAAM